MASSYKKKADKSTEKVKPSLDLFMILGNILVDKSIEVYENHIQNESFESVFSMYMILRYLSMNSNPNVRKIVMDNMENLEHLAESPEIAYKLLLTVVPKTYSRFTPYIRSGFQPKKVEKVCHKLTCGYPNYM